MSEKRWGYAEDEECHRRGAPCDDFEHSDLRRHQMHQRIPQNIGRNCQVENQTTDGPGLIRQEQVGHQIGYGAYLWQIRALQCMGHRLLCSATVTCGVTCLFCPNKRVMLFFWHPPCALSLFRYLYLGQAPPPVSRQPAARVKLG